MTRAAVPRLLWCWLGIKTFSFAMAAGVSEGGWLLDGAGVRR